MARVFITGSADGLGRAAAQTLLDDGHEVVVHARNNDRLTAVHDLIHRGAAAVVGDLSDPDQTRGIADQVNDLGQMNAVIHNAGVYTGPHVMPVNIVAPYLLTALIDRPQRLVYLSSGDHRRGQPRLTGIDWGGRTTGSYPDSKLFVTVLSGAVTRLRRPSRLHRHAPHLTRRAPPREDDAQRFENQAKLLRLSRSATWCVGRTAAFHAQRPRESTLPPCLLRCCSTPPAVAVRRPRCPVTTVAALLATRAASTPPIRRRSRRSLRSCAAPARPRTGCACGR
jgi:hypothetical protein